MIVILIALLLIALVIWFYAEKIRNLERSAMHGNMIKRENINTTS